MIWMSRLSCFLWNPQTLVACGCLLFQVLMTCLQNLPVMCESVTASERNHYQHPFDCLRAEMAHFRDLGRLEPLNECRRDREQSYITAVGHLFLRIQSCLRSHGETAPVFAQVLIFWEFIWIFASWRFCSEGCGKHTTKFGPEFLLLQLLWYVSVTHRSLWDSGRASPNQASLFVDEDFGHGEPSWGDRERDSGTALELPPTTLSNPGQAKEWVGVC